MKTILLKYLILCLNKTSIMVGGQAVIEGVMMRVPGAYATAVRIPTGEIKIEKHTFRSSVETYQLQNIPIIRGFCHLIDSMRIGFKTLEWSASFFEDNQSSSNPYVNTFMSFMSIIIAITIFMGIPYYITEIGLAKQEYIVNNNFIFNIIAGTTRIAIFILYLYLISQLKDIKRLFQYHGAEHKVVYNFESGEPLNTANASKFSTKHPRCGTSFVFILMIVTIVTYSLLDSTLSYMLNIEFTVITRILTHLMFLPVVVGLGYEILKFLAKHQDKYLFHILSLPGLWLQNITTNPPNKEQLEVSITALQSAFNNQTDKYEGKIFNAEAI